jgi:chromosomal replication initiation ATPase DnaA
LKNQPLTPAELSAAEHVILQICKRFKVSRSSLMSRDRHWIICWPRFLAMALIRESCAATQNDLAALFNRTPQNCMYGIGVVESLTRISKQAKSDLLISRQWVGLQDPTPAEPEQSAAKIYGI